MTLVYTRDLVCRLPQMLSRATALGADHCPQALPLELCAQLLEELGVDGYHDRADVFLNAGGSTVEQEFETLTLRYPMPGFPMVGELGQELGSLVRAVGDQNYANWEPNDVAAQLYRPHHIGITKHRDFFRDRVLVAVFTLSGAGHFTIWDEVGRLHRPWTLTAGSLVLLRAPELGDHPADNRLYHAISGPITGERLSLAYRLNIDS